MTTKNRKPTMMEMKQVVTNVLVELANLSKHVTGLDVAFSRYVEFKGDETGYLEFMNTKMKESKDGSSTKESGKSSGGSGDVSGGKETTKATNPNS